MINDFNIEGVFVPGLLLISLVALTCTLLLVQLFSLSKGYRRLPFRPMIDFPSLLLLLPVVAGTDRTGVLK